MAQYFTDFREYPVGQQPADWTVQVDSRDWTVVDEPTAAGGKALLRGAVGSTGRYALVWDQTAGDPDSGNYEVFLRCKWAALPPTNDCFALARGVFRGGSDYDFIRHGAVPNGTYNTLTQNSYKGGEYANMSASSGMTYEEDVWYNILASGDGATCRVKAWKHGDDEDSGASLFYSSTPVTAAGFLGLFAGVTEEALIDVFGVGTGTDPAPRESSAESAPVLANPEALSPTPQTFSGAVVTDKAGGTLYYAVSLSPDAPEDMTAPVGVAASGSQAVVNAGTQNVSGGGLVGGEVYYAHFMHRDEVGDSPTVSTQPFSFADFVKTPTDLSVSEVTATSAKLNWVAGV